MKASKEVKRWINRQRRHMGKRNGVVPWLFDAPRVEIHMATNKRINKRASRDELVQDY